MAIRDIIVRIRADVSRAIRNLDDLADRAERNADAFDKVGKAALAMGTAAAAGLALTAREAIKFESSFASVTKTVNGTEQQLAALSDGLRKMARDDVPMNVNGLNEIAAAAGQLGIRTENIIGFTKVMADLGVATNLAGEEAAMTLAQFANITQMDQGEFDRLGSTIVDLGNNLATTEADIADMAIRLASAGSQAGLTEAEILSLAGAARSVGIEAEAGGTAFSRILIEMRNAAMDGGDSLQMFADTAGMTAEQFAASFGDNAAGALITFTEGLARMEEAGGNSNRVLEELGLADIRVSNALRSAASSGDLFRESLELGNAAWEENTALATEAAARYETTESQIQFAKNAITDLAIELGEHLLPAINAMLGAGGEMADFFGGMPDGVQATAVALTAVGGGLGLIGGAVLIALPRIVATKAALATLGITAASVRATLLTMNAAVMATGIGAAAVALGVMVSNLIDARREARGLVEEIEAVSSGPTQALAAMNDELERQNELRGSAADRVLDAVSFWTPEFWQNLVTPVGEARTAVDELSGAISELEAQQQAEAMLELSDAAAMGAVGFRQSSDAIDGWQGRLIAANAETEEAARIADLAARAASGWREALQATGDTEAFGLGVQTWVLGPLEQVAAALTSFSDPLGAYTGMLAAKEQAERDAAQATAESTESSADSWEDYYDDVSVSASEWIEELEAQVTAQAEWAANMSVLATRVSATTLEELGRLGPEGAPLVADLVDSTDEELVRLDAVMLARTTDAINTMEGQIAGAAEVGRRFGQSTVDAMNGQLARGTLTAAQIAHSYSEGLRLNVNPLLIALGVSAVPGQGFVTPRVAGTTVVAAADGALMEDHTAQIAPGGAWRVWAEPETGGEAYIPLAPSKRNRSIDIWKQTGKLLGVEHAEHFADGGFSSIDQVPAVPSMNPFTGAVAEPATASMEHVREQLIEWLKVNLAPKLGPGIGSKAMLEAIVRLVPGTYLMSGDRPGAITATGNPSYHGMGRAVDLGFGSYSPVPTPGMDRIGMAIHDNYYADTKEMIYSRPGFPEIRNGRPHDYTGITRAMHYNHVHWAMANGGIVSATPGGTPVLVGEAGQDEAITPLRNGALDVNVTGWSSTVSPPNVRPPEVNVRPDGGPIDPRLPLHLLPTQVTDPRDPISMLPPLLEMAANQEMLRIEGLTAAERLAEVRDLMGDTIPYTDEWVELLREAERLEADVLREAEAVTAELERQADAQRRVAEEAERHAQSLEADLERLLDQRDALNAQAAQAAADYARAVAEAQRRASQDIDGLLAARNDALFGAFGGIANPFTVGWGNTAGQLTSNISDQIALFDEWADGLAQLRADGISEDLITHLGLDDPASLAQVRMLLGATSADLSALDAALAARREQTAGQVAGEADMLLGALGTAITTVRDTLGETLIGLEVDLTDRLDAIAAEAAMIGLDTGRGYAEMMADALTSGLPGVIAAAQKYQDALRDAEAAQAALAAMSTTTGPGHYVRPSTGGMTSTQLRAMQATPMSGPSFPSTLTLEVDGRQFTAYVKDKSREAVRQDAQMGQLQGVSGG